MVFGGWSHIPFCTKPHIPYVQCSSCVFIYFANNVCTINTPASRKAYFVIGKIKIFSSCFVVFFFARSFSAFFFSLIFLFFCHGFCITTLICPFHLYLSHHLAHSLWRSLSRLSVSSYHLHVCNIVYFAAYSIGMLLAYCYLICWGGKESKRSWNGDEHTEGVRKFERRENRLDCTCCKTCCSCWSLYDGK